MTYQQYLRSNSTTLELGEVLQATPDVLLGVGPGAVHVLQQLGVDTVFDLARSSTFGAAAQVQQAATDPDSVDSRAGDLPTDLFTKAPVVPIAQTPAQDVGTLRLVASANLNGALSESLDVRSIRDLALWPPYRAAKAILAEAAGTTPVSPEGPPADLVPMSGRYPTERAFYSTFVLADVGKPANPEPIALEGAGALDPTTAVSGSGFTQPMLGARLTFAQSWYSQGVALGQLLHSLALAPGESTRVAMIDWSRQQTGTQLEQAGQSEQLVGDMTHKRAMSEVQNAVAQEAQQGFSQSDSTSAQTQGGGGGGLSLGPLTVGGSGAYASNSAHATTLTGTSGVRNIAASMQQNIADSTHQAASSSRNMFASVVRELSQSEHEQVSTRVVANFNHMHALTVQYYEVVQIYRTRVGLHTFEPCLFVPMRLIDFQAPGDGGAPSPGSLIARRYQRALQAAALDTETRDLLAADASRAVTIEIRPNVQRLLPVAPDTPTDPATGSAAPVRSLDTVDGSVIEVPQDATLQSIHATFPCKRAGLHFPAGAPEGPYLNVEPNIGSGGDQLFNADLTMPVPLADVASMTVDTTGQQTGYITLDLVYRGAPLKVDVPVVAFGLGTGQGDQVMTFHRGDPAETLQARLAQDQLYYSQVVWQAMDSATISLLLAPYTYAGQPLAQVVDPAPIGTSGNYLIFRMPGEARDLLDGSAPGTGLAGNADWVDWVRKHADYETTVEDFVPLPSGGVFAEAVLGRANSAEKLDITRFWNWQDSPIPLQAPEIAPVQTGSRAQADNTTPTGFASPIVAFNNPTPLPDPAGLSAALGAISNGSMFRDMSGSATTQALALAALAGSGSGATSAGSQAAAYAALAAQKEIEMAKVAAGVLTGGVGGAGAGTVTEQGARINEGRSLDERAAAKPAAAEGDASGASTHETRAAEGESGTAAEVLGKLAGSPAEAVPEAVPETAPEASSSSSSSASSSTKANGKKAQTPA